MAKKKLSVVDALREAIRKTAKFAGRVEHHKKLKKKFIKEAEVADKAASNKKLSAAKRKQAAKDYQQAVEKVAYHKRQEEKYAHSQNEWEAIEKRRRKKVKEWKEAQKPKTGTGAYGGSESIIRQEVLPVADLYDTPAVSFKRAANHSLSISNPSSDHNEANTTAFAVDLATFSGANLANAIANKLGISGYRTGTYTSYYIKRAGKTFRVQILWAVSGHYDHVHVGVRLA